MMLKKVFLMAFVAAWLGATAQNQPPENWFNLDATADGVQGMSVEKAYKTILAGRKSEPIIVAVLDSGVDPNHEDLKNVMWMNEKEAHGQPGVDDDGNGYVDDIHGWNFLGGKDGRNLQYESLESARALAAYEKRFGGKKAADLSGSDKKDYAAYLKLLDAFNDKKANNASQQTIVNQLIGDLETAETVLKKELGKETYDQADLDRLAKSKDKTIQKAVRNAKFMLAQGYSMESLLDAKKSFDAAANYNYRLDYNPRADIVKDNPDDLNDRFYGNNDVQGPDALHGTHVAGIIAAERNNGKGINGVADNVRIMSVRLVPDGDENDKDVALGIRYAVDNGAQVINMSFGKSLSPHKQWVDDAVRYAEAHDVLLVHAAGNDAENNDSGDHFYPNDQFQSHGLFKPKKASNWLEIGAFSWKSGPDRTASFSNFGKKNVDLFSPGVDIFSTVPDSKYKSEDGTSMASPATAGVAALVRSYFPALTAKQVKQILMESTTPISGLVKKPGTDDLVELSSLCVTGGVVNAEKALELASKTKGKKKVKPRA